MALFVFSLGALACVVCSFLLARAYLRMGRRLLLWCALCFALLALNNALVVIDAALGTAVNLVGYGMTVSLCALAAMLYGFMWEVE